MPKRGIDLSTMTRAERWCALLGFALFINALIPYWYRVHTPGKTFLHNGGLFGWGVLCALAGFAAAILALTRHVRTPAAFNDHSIYATLGIVATIALAVHGARATPTVWIGFWLELVLAAGLGVAGILRVRERARGWV
ncbi:MAG: hypothetical protein NVSMB57_06560 [Actinomycetota bacterium]